MVYIIVFIRGKRGGRMIYLVVHNCIHS